MQFIPRPDLQKIYPWTLLQGYGLLQEGDVPFLKFFT